jgi:hypothetical protein
MYQNYFIIAIKYFIKHILLNSLHLPRHFFHHDIYQFEDQTFLIKKNIIKMFHRNLKNEKNTSYE